MFCIFLYVCVICNITQVIALKKKKKNTIFLCIKSVHFKFLSHFIFTFAAFILKFNYFALLNNECVFDFKLNFAILLTCSH